MRKTTEQHRPWYKEPWPWVAIAIPASAVIMGFTTLYLAVSNPDPVIVDDQKYREISSGLKAQSASESEAAEQGEAGDSSDGEY